MRGTGIRMTAAALAVLLWVGAVAPPECGTLSRRELAQFVFALLPTVPGTVTVSDSSIHIQSADAVRQEDGRFRVTVIFTTDAARNRGGALTAAVFCDGQSVSFPLTRSNMGDTHRVILTDVERADRVRVEISGYQTAWNGKLRQVHGEALANVSGERCLNIRNAPAGAEFELYRVADLSDLLSGVVVLSRVPTALELAERCVSANYITTLVTDSAGCAAYNFSKAGYADGVYLVVNRGAGEPFYVTVPKPAPEKADWQYTVTVSPGEKK